MGGEVRFTVSDESEAALLKVEKKLNLSHNQAAHYCMALGVAMINSAVPDDTQMIERVAELVASKIAPGMQEYAGVALSVLLKQDSIKHLLGDPD